MGKLHSLLMETMAQLACSEWTWTYVIRRIKAILLAYRFNSKLPCLRLCSLYGISWILATIWNSKHRRRHSARFRPDHCWPRAIARLRGLHTWLSTFSYRRHYHILSITERSRTVDPVIMATAIGQISNLDSMVDWAIDRLPVVLDNVSSIVAVPS